MRKIEKLSIVVPCHNEEEVLPSTHAHLTLVAGSLVENHLCHTYEILYVNNGSTDATRQVLDRIYQSDRHAHVIELRRNFGYQGSISAGLAYALGDAVVTIDADLQDPPEAIGEMIERYAQGYDLVLGVRSDRTSDSFFKRLFSQSYYRILKSFGIEIVYNHGDFRLMARAIVDEFNALSERNRLIRAMILKLDDHYAVVEYPRKKRLLGKTKFNIPALLSLSWEGVVSFSYVPLRLASLLGFLMCFASFAAACWVLNLRLSNTILPGWASTVLPIFAIGGVQLLVLGLIGEYIGRLYVEVKQRPLFSVRRELKH